MRVSVVFFTSKGEQLYKKLSPLFAGEELIYKKDEIDLKAFVRKAFKEKSPLIFISALPIAVRLIAPCIKSKENDIAVIVLDELGRFTIPVLSNHIGGGGALAEKISLFLNNTAVITTATDINGVFAADSWAAKNGCAILDTRYIAPVSMALLEGGEVSFTSDFAVSGVLPKKLTDEHSDIGICLSVFEKKPFKTTLNIVPKIVVLGVGCKRGVNTEYFEEKLLAFLKEHSIALKSLAFLTSIDLKKDEECILAFCRKYGLELRTASAEALQSAEGDFSPPSEFVQSVTGTDNVCERSAAYFGGKITVKKTSKGGITFAVGLLDFEPKF